LPPAVFPIPSLSERRVGPPLPQDEGGQVGVHCAPLRIAIVPTWTSPQQVMWIVIGAVVMIMIVYALLDHLDVF
jgi:hypothetical protein